MGLPNFELPEVVKKVARKIAEPPKSLEEDLVQFIEEQAGAEAAEGHAIGKPADLQAAAVDLTLQEEQPSAQGQPAEG